MSFKDLALEAFYEGWGDEISQAAINPILREAFSYDRLSSYFTISSFLSIADGLEKIWRRKGSIRLVMGLHDLDEDVLLASKMSGSSDFFQTFDSIKQRILNQVSALEDEMHAKRIETFALMLRDGFVSLKVASHPQGTGAAIFHNKRFIFRDDAGDTITGSSGMNETVRGLTRNYDELTLQRSWLDTGGQLEKHVESFERLWAERVPNLVVREVDPEFSLELLAASQQRRKPLEAPKDLSSGFSLENAIKSCPSYFFIAQDGLSLFPHQERVVLEATDSFPIRKMFADEVGLGKTLEAGATLRFLSAFAGCENVLLACPQGLMRQWREEMHTHFREEYWVWDSGAGVYESPTGQESASPDGLPFFIGAPSKKIISSHLLRTERYRKMLEEEEGLQFDAFVLDEAHSARMSIDSQGRIKTTKLWEIAQILGSRSAHCILLTATPMQIHPIELYGQLIILGLEGGWSDSSNFLQSIEIMASQKDTMSLEDCGLVASLIKDSSSKLHLIPDIDGAREFVVQLVRIKDDFGRAIHVNQNLELAYRAFVLLHPVHQMVIRNTRESLVQMGYKFPKRIHQAPEVFTSPQLTDFLRSLSVYLREGYGALEKLISDDGKAATGFTVSTYYQRLASSLIAAQQSLNRRRLKLNRVSEFLEQNLVNLDWEEKGDFEDEDLDDLDDVENVSSTLEKALRNPKRRPALRQAVQSELMFLSDLMSILDSMKPNFVEHDAKFQVALQLLQKEHEIAPVLVFSRYTDTLLGFIDYCEERLLSKGGIGYGLYSGREIWIQTGDSRLPSSKAGVVKGLNNNSVRVLFCSDAASEGLNLQAAGSIINLDVPWNPARLEQRIGRIDRLGQRKAEVRVYNLWYPNSVEAEMYKRLLARKATLELAVGAFPSLVADSIKNSVAEFFGKSTNTAPDVISELELLRNKKQAEALARLWTLSYEAPTRTRELRDSIRNVFLGLSATKAIAESLSIDEGSPESFTLFHPLLQDWWRDMANSQPTSSGNCLSAAVLGGLTAGIIVGADKTSPRPLSDDGVAQAVSALGGQKIGEFLTDEKPFSIEDPYQAAINLLQLSGFQGLAELISLGHEEAEFKALPICREGETA